MAPEAAQCEQQGVDEGAGAALEAARRPDARQPPQEQPEIQAADLQAQALEDVAVSAQVRTRQVLRRGAHDRGRRQPGCVPSPGRKRLQDMALLRRPTTRAR